MSFSSVGYFHILATICLLSSLSALSLAKRRHKSKESGGTEHSPTKSSSDLVKSASCGGSSDPILTPSFIQPCYLYSRRAMMFLQILPSGKINGTNSYNSRYGKRFHFFAKISSAFSLAYHALHKLQLRLFQHVAIIVFFNEIFTRYFALKMYKP